MGSWRSFPIRATAYSDRTMPLGNPPARDCLAIPEISHRQNSFSARIGGRNSFHNQMLTGKFPTQWNRDLIGLYQGIKSAHQGKFPPEQGSPPFGLAFLTMVRGRASVERVGANSNKRWWGSTTRRSSPGPRCMVASLSHTSWRRGAASQTTYASP